jgi:hypothetical protein
LRIEDAAPGFVRPSGDSDANNAGQNGRPPA